MKLHLVLLTFFYSAVSFGQQKTVEVWPGKIPGAIDAGSYKKEIKYDSNGKSPRISKVTDPVMEVYLPPAEKANGTAVVICPGGGYSVLAIDHEGRDIAAWFNSLGIAAFVLQYRLPSDVIMEEKSTGPLQDAQEAMRIVRRNAGKWHIKTDRIGIMGFSAGGHLASTLSTHYNAKVYPVDKKVSARPDFSVLVYPVISMDEKITHKGSRNNLIGKNPDPHLVKEFSNELMVSEDTPKTFMVHSSDDTVVPVENSIRYYLALKDHGVPAELHVYPYGGHGYGTGRSDKTESTWPRALENWLKMNDWL
ncbi:alpha/beta hydrolase [Sinomicrobium soli]|uniref:alpha/beta hydrolase n=1 Tax=Sinomicrobium sp. N-1-3-6 TaxID=2219864 RepID=UPI000DCC3D2B|nr:alpha/beta hydrolase [Sinomicrobium sp. N-1-3-6]RAV28136.1 alpha/beta hydrolase [Sinomicrobium sp. N-1-3-6]